MMQILSIVYAYEDTVKLILIEGNWGDEIGYSDFFTMQNSDSPKNDGDPVEYSRRTDFDNHYHDFDEVWVILEGEAVAYSEGKQYRLKAGNCLLHPWDIIMICRSDIRQLKESILKLH
jgi:mannose-6-phosphate isomerase-like protein (cupin superfamily)